jgi:hypothetical protein
MKALALGLALAAAQLVAFQAEDVGDRCDNFKDTAHKCGCARATMCAMPGKPINPDEGAVKCDMRCKPDHCHCLSPCTSRKPGN